MRLYHVEQGSEDWHRARAGAITASKVKLIRDVLKSGPSKGDYSKAAKDYAFRLAIERESDEPLDDDEFSPWQGERGHRLEPEARQEHELQAGVLVQTVGFVSTEDGKFGASADGLIGDDEGAEYKCFLAPSKLRAILLDKDLSEVIDQCQFGMAITGRKRWHFGLYCPALRVLDKHFTLHIIERDEDYIDRLWMDLLAFDRLVESYRSLLIGVEPPTTPEPPPWTAAPAAAKVSLTEPTF